MGFDQPVSNLQFINLFPCHSFSFSVRFTEEIGFASAKNESESWMAGGAVGAGRGLAPVCSGAAVGLAILSDQLLC